MKHLVFIMALFFPPFLAVSSVAQTTTGGTIFGRITDPSGAPVQDVEITTKSPNVGGDFKAVSDSTGDYRFAGLPIATNYTITVEAKGFSRFERKNLVVRAGVTISVDIQLAIGSVNESVEVTGDPPLIDTQNAEQTVNLSGELLRNIPITGRREWSDTLK